MKKSNDSAEHLQDNQNGYNMFMHDADNIREEEKKRVPAAQHCENDSFISEEEKGFLQADDKDDGTVYSHLENFEVPLERFRVHDV